DQAAVLGWRLDDTGNQNGFEPLSWLPAIPQRLHDHQTWGPHLAARARMVAELANRIRRSVGADRLPIWVGEGLGQPPSRLVEDIEVWRAAGGVSPDDQRPTGPDQRQKTARRWQRQLDEAIAPTRRGNVVHAGARLAGMGTTNRAKCRNGKKRQLRTHSGRAAGRTLAGRSERPTTAAHRSSEQAAA